MSFQGVAWRRVYVPEYNPFQRHQHMLPALPPPPAPVARSISPASSVDSVYWSLSESGPLSPNSEASGASGASSASSMLAPPVRRNKYGFVYTIDMKSQGYRIDRKSFEQLMVVCGHDGVAALFTKIMGLTSTMIHWPYTLRSDDMEDPFMRITGTPENIILAKRALFGSFLVPGKLSKLQLIMPKCDIDHITGYILETITESTATRIYFEKPKEHEPDNHTNIVVYGPVACLEKGRKALRSAAPFVITFEMYVSTEFQSLIQRQWIQQLECKYDVKISFYFTAMDNIYQVVVEGSENEAQNMSEVVKQMTAYNLEHIIIPVFRLIMGVSKQTVEILCGDDKAILRTTMEHTNTMIEVVDTNEEDGSSKLIICGSIADIYVAKRELVGFVPIEMAFEIENTGQDMEGIQAIAKRYKLELIIKRRDDQNVIILQLKGTERYINNLYDAHQAILLLQVKPEVARREPQMAPILKEPVDDFAAFRPQMVGGWLEFDYSPEPWYNTDELNIHLPLLPDPLFVGIV